MLDPDSTLLLVTPLPHIYLTQGFLRAASPDSGTTNIIPTQ
jgi:hypothetical protein